MTQESKPPLHPLAKLAALLLLILIGWIVVGVLALLGQEAWGAVLR